MIEKMRKKEIFCPTRLSGVGGIQMGFAINRAQKV